MSRTIFVAGASGVIGRRLVPILIADGWQVVGMTRSAAKSALLAELGALPVVADVFDAPSLRRAIADTRPDTAVHQLTELPPGLDPGRMEEATRRNARIRDEGLERQVLDAPLSEKAKRELDWSADLRWKDAPRRRRCLA